MLKIDEWTLNSSTTHWISDKWPFAVKFFKFEKQKHKQHSRKFTVTWHHCWFKNCIVPGGQKKLQTEFLFSKSQQKFYPIIVVKVNNYETLDSLVRSPDKLSNNKKKTHSAEIQTHWKIQVQQFNDAKYGWQFAVNIPSLGLCLNSARTTPLNMNENAVRHRDTRHLFRI